MEFFLNDFLMILGVARHFDWENFAFGELKMLTFRPFLKSKLGGGLYASFA